MMRRFLSRSWGLYWLCLCVTAPWALAESASDVDEILRFREQLLETVGEINALNPFADSMSAATGLPASKGGASGLQSRNPQLAGRDQQAVQQLKALLAHPAVRGYLKFFQSPTFSEGARALSESQRKGTLAWVLLIWVLVMMLWKAKRLSQIPNSGWGQILWVHLSNILVLWAGIIVVIPWIILGESYRKVLFGLVTVLFA